MFGKLLYQRLYRLHLSFNEKVSVVVRKMYCSSSENNNTSINGQALDEYTKQPKSCKPVWIEEAEEFMLNLNEGDLKTKHEMEVLIEFMKQEGENVPEKLSAWDWKLLLTECRGYEQQVKYLQHLHRKEKAILSLKHKKEEEKFDWITTSFHTPFVYRPDTYKRLRWWKGLESLKSDIPVIVDVDFNSNIWSQIKEYEQMRLVWSSNFNHLQPLDLHFTSIHKNFRMKEIFEGSNKNYRNLNFHKEHFTEIFSSKDLVYLSPDGPPMYDFDPNCIYVLGALQDLSPFASYTTARKYGIRCGSFPVREYLRLLKSSAVRVNLSFAFRIILDMYLTHSWIESFQNNLPERFYELREKYATVERVKNEDNPLYTKNSMQVPGKILNILNRK